ncbi:helix-turn-helix transcriptional regulator [Adhaeribacter swui]|uniref:Helix-turn-helix transcriptional regulator n=1 Tax=Adhaeribacter swui TaxID=2086471 RepID=A0A7G7G4T6_9BACT|nr:helix-turn-helix transcriptional regulator [Adhaeribacter swui]QNF32170.1 helix-turn-helix transcriptional regulator [Adhaeribacter swui]
MIYRQIKPHPALSAYIDSYWTLDCEDNKPECERIFPDGCCGLVINLGEKCTTDNGLVILHAGKPYLVGPMTTFKETSIPPGGRLIGVCFNPAAFSQFYYQFPLSEVIDKTVDFDLIPERTMQKLMQNTVSSLNEYFGNRLTSEKHNLIPIIKDIQLAKGQISIDQLARRNFMTCRQLERSFKKHIGLSPKEFTKITRFQTAFLKIKNNYQHKSLLDIAFDCGYYDHAHLTNEIKQYTGLTPSAI